MLNVEETVKDNRHSYNGILIEITRAILNSIIFT